ncbi:hypothetical protein BD324DRAFT_619602 [Kockovaella imperatae]|uniref:NmrA-like domain-containing protein n=1 Tax=Kockovaella imperatae TaxID=4999 RepID=A0A1Y1UMX2_9TREE|nr:hypothetical protein BD324DRAFT_619602 [Kockovaella imperatae]ORX39408.1 hypothetical protein BD324DRAFT_619602 [Kockovaella imperatae]
MSDQKKIFVFTATGDQGSSVAKYLAKTGQYEIWGLTRNTESDKAKELTQLGVKMVKGDMDDVSSYEPHLEGIHGAFVNADFWAKYFSNGFNGKEAGEYEYGVATRAIEAVVKAGAKHIIYSSLDDCPFVPHFHYKQEVSKWAKSKDYPVTNLHVAHYLSNLVKFPDFIKADGEGGYILQIAAADETTLGNFAVEQTGGWVVPIFADSKKYLGGKVNATSETLTVKEWAKEISEYIGKPVKTMGLTPAIYDDYSGLVKNGVPEELVLNYKGFNEGYFKWNLKESLEVFPDAWDTKAWAKNTGALDQFKA